MDNEDRKMAEALAEGLEWLGREGRQGARLVQSALGDKPDLEEALSWLEAISNGEAI